MFLRKLTFALLLGLSLASTPFVQPQSSTTTSIMVQQRPVPVPDFKGKTLEQVRAEAVVPHSAKPLFQGIYPQGPAGGVVVSQSPVAHTPVVPGQARLLLTLDTPKPSTPKRSAFQTILEQLGSQPPKRTHVPQLYGDSRDVAAQLLQAARLRGNFLGDAGGVVAQQSPPAGNPVEPGSTVTVTLALPPVIVPSLYGMTQAQAIQRLRESSLQLGGIYGQNTEGSTVASQSLVAGTHVPPGTSLAVTLVGPPPPVSPQQAQPLPPEPPVAVPSLSKMSESQAAAVLASGRLHIGRVTGPSAGFVSDQAPMAGSMVNAGTSVDFTLQLAPVVVPNLMEESENIAEERLKIFGLQPRISRAENWNANVAHVVVRQSPEAGTTVDVGSAVDVVIGNVVPPPPPPWWQKVPGWVWLAIGVSGGVLATLIRKPPPPKPEVPAQPTSPAPPAVCTLVATRVAANTRVGASGSPHVRFRLGLRDRMSVAHYQIDAEPVVRRKG